MDSMVRDNFLFYGSWLEIIKTQYADDKAKQKELVFAIVEYGIEGTKSYPLEEMFLMQAQAQIDSAKQKHQKRVEAGRAGGRAGKGSSKARVGNKNAKRKQTQPNDNDNVNDNDNENDNIINRVNESSSDMPLEGQSSKKEYNQSPFGEDPMKLYEEWKKNNGD